MVLIVFIWMQIRFYDDLVIIAHDSCYCFDISQIFLFSQAVFVAKVCLRE